VLTEVSGSNYILTLNPLSLLSVFEQAHLFYSASKNEACRFLQELQPWMLAVTIFHSYKIVKGIAELDFDI
jgi:hypothetical protein